MADTGGMQALRALGARAVPIVARGSEYVFAQVIRDVVEFLGLEDDPEPQLSPAQLAQRCDTVLAAAIRLTRQMPDERLEDQLPNRPRSWRVLMHHVFQIPVSFLDLEATGEALQYEHMVAPPPDDMRTSTAIADFGTAVRARFRAWWAASRSQSFDGQVPTYFGATTRHEMLERTVWHSAQHTRQVASLLEQAGITPEQPLGAEHIAGLPLTDRIWD